MRGTATEVWGNGDFETMQGVAAVWKGENNDRPWDFSFLHFSVFLFLLYYGAIN
jgi:hypothetical protein